MAIPIQNNKANNKKQFERIFINDSIKANTIIVTDEDGTSLGTHRRDYALAMAEERGLDLVQMSYDFAKNTAVCKIIDWGKFQYDKKKETNAKKKTANKGLKEIDFKYNIGDGDLKLKIKKGVELLGEGYMLRFVIKLKGRENIYKDKAKEKMVLVIESLGEVGRTQGIKEEPRGFSAVFNPKKN